MSTADEARAELVNSINVLIDRRKNAPDAEKAAINGAIQDLNQQIRFLAQGDLQDVAKAIARATDALESVVASARTDPFDVVLAEAKSSLKKLAALQAQIHAPEPLPKVDSVQPQGPEPSVDGAPIPPVASAATAGEFDAVIAITQNGRIYNARTKSGFSFIVGAVTEYEDDMKRKGLFQGETSAGDSERKFGVYKAADFAGIFGPWAHFIEPTLTAEGGARFATINTYDRAAFTFGAPQLAAHTPGANFIEYFRQLLALPDADKHFPELSLRRNATGTVTVHRRNGDAFQDLETVVEVTRPNGKREKQLALLMAYLNSSPTDVDDAELSAAARLMNWLRLDPRAKELQIKVFIDAAKANLAEAKRKVNGFTGNDWRVALWIMDIRHQGRGNFADITGALASGEPEAQLRRIGTPKYQSRIDTVAAAVEKLNLTGFEV